MREQLYGPSPLLPAIAILRDFERLKIHAMAVYSEVIHEANTEACSPEAASKALPQTVNGVFKGEATIVCVSLSVSG